MRLLLLLVALAGSVFAESLILEAEEMEGNWPRGMAFGASGTARAANGTRLTKTVHLEGGEYRVYIRAVNSQTQRATYLIRIGDQQLRTAPQGKALRIGWIRAGSVRLPRGPAVVSIEDGESDGPEVLDAIALASDPFDDRAGRGLACCEHVLRLVTRMTAPLPTPRSAKEAMRRQQEMRRRLLRAIGLDPLPPRTPLNPLQTGRADRGDYVIEKIAFESRPRHVVPGLLYVPKNVPFPVPAVVGVIGHWNAGKSSTIPQRRSIGLVKRGYVVLNIDPSYAWERRIPGNSEGSDPYVSGGAINGHMAWDVMRAVDYLLTRREVDGERIGITGASGGGQQALYAGAVDERLKAVAPAVYVWAFRDITSHWGYSSDNWVPGVLDNGDMAATLALIAPRALLVLSTTEDYVPVDGSKQQVEQVRGFYNALGAGEKIGHFIAPGEHDYSRPMREALYGFLDRWLKGVGDGSPQPEPELDLFPETAKELLVFPGGRIPAEGAATVRSIWTDRAVELRQQLPERNPALRQNLRDKVLRVPPRRELKTRKDGDRLLITTEAGIEIPARMSGSGRQAVIWVANRDVSEEARSEPVAALARKATVLVIEPRCISLAADRGLMNQGAILAGRPLPGMWAQDVLGAYDFLRRRRGFREVSVAADGAHAGLSALLATVLEPGIHRVAINGLFPTFVSIVGRDAIAEIPGILRLADIEHLVVAAGNGRVVLNNLQPSPIPVRAGGTQKPPLEFFTSVLP